MIPAYVVYQENKGKGHDCFLTFFRPTNWGKISKYFFRNLRLKIHRLTKFNEKKNYRFKPYQFILSTLKCTSILIV